MPKAATFSELTPTQVGTLKTYIQGVPALLVMTSGPTTDLTGLAELLNAEVSPTVKAWQFVSNDQIVAAWDVSELDGLSQGKRDAMQLAMQFAGGFNCEVSTGPKVITDLFPNSGAGASRVALLALAQTNATLAQQVLGGSVVVSASPQNISALVRNFTGQITFGDLLAMFTT